ncbi:VOC family protein [Deinococcus sonorensis]|uniref:VOC family protein n=2 Tax=Deinococcus sonorensis TaxID=309891 RepID=A0AAU7U9H9_9DEIO
MSLQNITLLVADVERSRRFYQEAFGLSESGRSAPGMALLNAGGVTLLLQPAGASAAPVTPGGVELGFAVPDIAQARERLARLGVWVGEGQRMGWGEGFDARDPDGHALTVYHQFGDHR